MPPRADVDRRAATLQVRQVRLGACASIGNRRTAAGVSRTERPIGVQLGEAGIALRDVSLLQLGLHALGSGAH
jgi:hypothetical protein